MSIYDFSRSFVERLAGSLRSEEKTRDDCHPLNSFDKEDIDHVKNNFDKHYYMMYCFPNSTMKSTMALGHYLARDDESNENGRGFERMDRYIKISASKLFDDQLYSTHNPELSNYDLSPLGHYLGGGWRIKSPVSEIFDLEYYTNECFPLESFRSISPIEHYVFPVIRSDNDAEGFAKMASFIRKRRLDLERSIES